MKNTIFVVSLLAFVASCDAPQRTRAPSTFITDNSYSNGGSTSGFGSSPITDTAGSNSGSTSGSTNGSTSGSTGGSGTGFENCDINSSKGYVADLGHVGVCQSTTDETLFKFRPTISSTQYRVCLIPTYRDSSGASTYIGNPQCTYTTANQVVSGKLYKDRPGFSTYPINGVIILKEPLLPEYIACMQGYVNWPANVCTQGAYTSSYCSYWVPRCPSGARTNVQCDAEGRNYMATACNSFKSKYAAAYLDIATR